MADYKVLIKPSAVKEVEAIPAKDRERVVRKIRALTEDPRSTNQRDPLVRLLLRSSAFVRAAKTVVRKRPQKAETIRFALELLSANAFDSRLKTHKLKVNSRGLGLVAQATI